MKYVLLIICIGFISGQVLDQRYHTTEEIYSLLDSLNQLEELDDIQKVYTNADFPEDALREFSEDV